MSYSDAFTGADGTALATHDANWKASSDADAISNLAIYSNAVRVGAWATVHAYYDLSTSDTSEGVILANITTVLPNAVTVRNSPTSAGYYLYLADASGGNWHSATLSKGPGLNYLTDLTVEEDWPQNVNHAIKLVASGTNPVKLEAWVDGAYMGFYNDSTSPIASGKTGFALFENGGANQIAFDTWNDGAAAGGLSIPVAMHHYMINLK